MANSSIVRMSQKQVIVKTPNGNTKMTQISSAEVKLGANKFMGFEIPDNLVSAFNAISFAYSMYSSLQTAQFQKDVMTGIASILQQLQIIEEKLDNIEHKLDEALKEIMKISKKLSQLHIRSDLRVINGEIGRIKNDLARGEFDKYDFKELQTAIDKIIRNPDSETIYFAPQVLTGIVFYIPLLIKLSQEKGKFPKDDIRDILDFIRDLKEDTLDRINQIELALKKYQSGKNFRTSWRGNTRGLIAELAVPHKADVFYPGLIHDLDFQFNSSHGNYYNIKGEFRTLYAYRLYKGYLKNPGYEKHNILFFPRKLNSKTKLTLVNDNRYPDLTIENKKKKSAESKPIDDWLHDFNLTAAYRSNPRFKRRSTSRKENYTTSHDYSLKLNEANELLGELYLLTAHANLIDKSFSQLIKLDASE